MNAILIGLTGAVVLAPLARRTFRRSFDPFEPVVAFAVAWLLMFVLRPAAELWRGEPLYVRPTQIIHLYESFTLALACALLGAIAFVAAYESDVGRRAAARLPAPAPQFGLRRTVVGLLAVGAIALVGLGLFLARAGMLSRSGLQQLLGGRTYELTEAEHGATYLWQLSLALVPAAVGLLALAWNRRSFVLGALGGMLVGLVLLRALPVGSRMMLLPFLGALFVYGYLARGRRPRLWQLALVGVAGVVASSLLLQTRGGQRNAPLSLPEAASALLAHPSLVLEPLTDGSDTEMVTALAAALQIIPREIPFQYGRGLFGDLVTRPIPRALWPGKPLPPREEVISVLWPNEYAAHVANPEFSVLLVFYVDLGVPGVVLGMALYGVLARVAFEYLRRYPTRLAVRLLYALGLPFLVIALRDSPVDLVNRATFIWLPLFVVLWAARVRHGARLAGTPVMALRRPVGVGP